MHAFMEAYADATAPRGRARAPGRAFDAAFRSRRGAEGLAGARVMSYTILELRKVLVNAQTDGIQHQIPRYAGAPRDRAGVGAAKQVSNAGVKVTTRGIRYGYIGLISINPRQTPNKRHRVGSVASIRILTVTYLRPDLSSYPYSCSTPRRAIRPAASEPSMPRGRVHISMPSIDSAAHSATANGLLLFVCCVGGIVDVCEFRVCCVYVRVQQSVSRSCSRRRGRRPLCLPIVSRMRRGGRRARARGRARAGQSFAGRRCRGAGHAPLRRARPSEDENETKTKTAGAFRKLRGRACFEVGANARVRSARARKRKRPTAIFVARARPPSPLHAGWPVRCERVALPRYRTRRGRRARSHPFAGFRGRPSAKWEVRGGCFSREYIRGMRSR